MRFKDYQTDGFYDEMFDEQLHPRPGSEAVVERFNELPLEELHRRQQSAEKALLQMGITFSVYGDEQGTERIFPFDIVPRIIPQNEWAQIEAGLKQRVQALNLFIDDLYHEQKILKDGIIPEELVLSASGYRPECIGLNPPGGVWCHITGTDLVRGADGKFYVLEDNLRCPSGVSYVLQNRVVMKRSFPRAFDAARVVPVADYPNRLLELLQWLAPPRRDKPVVAVWTPGIYNSAYFEHSFLAQQMGVELVEGGDLVVVDDCVMMRTTTGLKPVDVLYRRIDDDFIDPEVFRADSMLGVPGLMRAYRAGHVALANAPGTGVADDKAVYAYVPEMIKYYLDEDCHPRQRRDLPLLAREGPAARAGQPRQAGGQEGRRVGRLRHAGRPPCQPRRNGPNTASRSRPTRATSSPSRPSPCPGCRPWSTTTSRDGTSTCVPTSSTARTSTSCPVA